MLPWLPCVVLWTFLLVAAAGGRWTLDWNGMEAAMRKHPETALLMLCNPYNPVGEPQASRWGTAVIVLGGWGGRYGFYVFWFVGRVYRVAVSLLPLLV